VTDNKKGESTMTSDLARRVQANPRYQELLAKRTRFGWTLTALMLLAYFGYVSVIAFDKQLLARPIGDGVMSWGIPIGFGLIVFTVLITALYVWRANAEFDALTKAVVEEAGQ
jgi:uncharacterized membrane protein (DUF485 family)